MRANSASDQTAEKDEASFEITSIAIGQFEQHPAVPADDEAAQVIEVLESLGARAVELEIVAGTKSQRVVTGYLEDWAERAHAHNSLLYWVGHGQANEDGAWLAVHETRSFMGDGTGVGPAAVADHIAQHWHRRRDGDKWALVVIEACGAKRFVNLLDSELSRRQSPPQRLILFGVGGNGSSHLGSFRRALGSALHTYSDNDGHIRLGDLMLRTSGYLADDTLRLIDLAPEPVLPRRPVLQGGVTATLDVYAELQDFLHRLPADERGHFVPKAQGAEQGELAWYFTGRAIERQQICGWLREQAQGILIVTGRAGAGKSALLGHVLIYANDELRELLVRHGLIERLNEQELPPTGVFDSVLHLTGLTISDVVVRLLLALGEHASPKTLSESVECLISHLQRRERPFTLLVDALDEAHESQGIAESVLRRIAEQPGCRVVVGTRRSTLEGPDQPETPDENLIDALGRSSNNTTVEVARDPVAIGQYVTKRLRDAKKSGRLAQEFNSEEFASLIQAQPSRQFLYARLAVHEILAQRELATNRVWLLKLLRHDHRGLFDQAVKRMAALDPSNEVLLEALALAGGRGLPRADRIWAIVATALLDLGEFVTEQHIDRILETAAPYVMLDGEDGQSVYRLAHRTFQEHFLNRQAAWVHAPDGLRARHALIAAALVGFAKASSSREGNRYVQRHLAGHVAAAGLWTELVRHPDVLDRLDPSSLASESTPIGSEVGDW